MGCEQRLHNGGDTELGTEECIGVFQADGEPEATQGKVSIHKCSETRSVYNVHELMKVLCPQNAIGAQ